MTDRIEENEMKNDPILQAILTALRESGNTTKMLNPSRYYDVLLAKDALDSLLLKIGLEDKSTLKIGKKVSQQKLQILLLIDGQQYFEAIEI